MNQRPQRTFVNSIRKAFINFKPVIDKEELKEIRVFCWISSDGELNFDFEYNREDKGYRYDE